jgi:hypothetical protein
MRAQVRRSEWKYPGGIGELHASAHYRIFTSTDNRRLLASLPGFLEAAHANYIELTGLPDNQREAMDVYMLATREQWASLTRWIFGDGAPALGISAGGYSYKGVGVYWDLHRRATLSIAAHEGLHQFLHHRVRHRLPLCIEEGLATNAEGFHIRGDNVVFIPGHNPSRSVALRNSIVEGRWTPVRKLLPMNASNYMDKGQDYALGWYGQVWALMLFLRTDEAYRPGLTRMLSDSENGRFHEVIGVPNHALIDLQKRRAIYNRTVSEKLFTHYIDADLDAFEARYRSFCWKLAGL